MQRSPMRTAEGDLQLQPDEVVGIRLEDTSLFLGEKDRGRGVLYVTSEQLAWLGEPCDSFSLQYQSIVLHALSSSSNASQRPSLYCQIKGDALPNLVNGLPVAVSATDAEEPGEEPEEDEEKMIELKFIPSDPTCLHRLFSVVSEMAALHPDADADLDADEEELFDEATLRQQGWEFVDIENNRTEEVPGGDTTPHNSQI